MSHSIYISLDEAAERLSVSRKTIRRYIARNELEAVRVGPRLLRIKESDLELLGQPLRKLVVPRKVV